MERRLLLSSDPSPVSLTDITLKPGIEGIYGYPDRTEIAYCLSGSATVRDLSSGVWVAPPGSRFSFVAHEPTRLICVFDPPLVGDESGIVAESREDVVCLLAGAR